MRSTNETDGSEQLREALLDLERANARERGIRLEAEALLSGLRVLTDHERRDTMFDDLLRLFQGLLGFDDAFILFARGATELQAVASTSPRFDHMVWARGDLADRMSLDRPLAFFDIDAVSEWREQPASARAGVCSALHVLLRGQPFAAILVATHSSRGFFGDKHLRLAARFAPLASQALATYDYTLRLEQINAKLEQEVKDRERAEALAAKSQAQIINSSKMAALGEMAGGMAHEINSPLATIVSLAGQLRESLGEAPLDLEAIDDIGETIERTVKRIAKIVSGLRSMSRDDSGDPFVLTPVRSLIEETLVLCRERFAHQGIRLAVDEVALDVTIPCRPTQISQVLLNLLNNALDAVSALAEKWVTLSVTSLSEAVEISVTDSGNGIPEEVREKLFQPFYTTKEVGKGTGIGLSISRGLVEAHRGRLALDPLAPNTRFLIRLPTSLVAGPA